MARKVNVFTIEITETHLICAYLTVIKDKFSIAKVFIENIKDVAAEQVGNKIKSFAKTLQKKNLYVINVVPSNFAIYKNIEIPSIDSAEIKEIIELQAGRHTPYSKDEIIMDYLNVGVFHERYTKILLVIIKKDVVSQRYDIIKSAGFKAEKAVLSSEGIARWCPQFYSDRAADKPVGIVHINNVTIDFIVSFHEKSIYIRSVPFDLAQLNDDPKNIKKNFIDEIKKSLESYQAENIDVPPSKLYFTGLTDSLISFMDELKGAFGIDIDIFRHLEAIRVEKESAEIIRKYSDVSILAAVAASFTHESLTLDLIPEDIRIGKQIKLRAREITTAGILSMGVLMIFCAMLLTNVFLKKIYLNKLLLSYTKETKEAESLKDLSDRTGIIKKFLNKKGRSLHVLTELYNATPEEVFLSSISFQDDETLIFTGTADSMSRVFSLVTDLENNKSFKNVKVDFTKSRRVQGKEVADFGLTLMLEEAG